MVENEVPDKLEMVEVMLSKPEMVEVILSAMAACIENRCYSGGNVAGIRCIQSRVRRDLVWIDELLEEF